MFAAWGRLVYRRRRTVLALSGALFVVSAGVAALGNPVGGNQLPAGTDSARAQSLLQAELPKTQGTFFALLFTSPSLPATDAAFSTAVLAAVQPLRQDPHVTQVRTPYDVQGRVTPSMLGQDGHSAFVTVTLADDIRTALGYYPELRSSVHPGPLTVAATGELAFQSDVYASVDHDLRRSEALTIPLTLLLLLLVFAGAVAALLPVGVGALAVVGGVAGTFTLARVTDVSPYALNIVSLIGLGVAIDYSLFVVSRFREELAGGRNTEEALVETMVTTGRSVAFSGLTVAVGLCGLLFFAGSFLASMGLAGAFVVLLAVVYALSFLAALLAVLGPRVNRLRLPVPALRGDPWGWLARSVMRRPLLALAPALAIVLITGSPFEHLQLAQAGMTTLPTSAEARQAWQAMNTNFPAQEQTRIFTVVRFPGQPLSGDHVGALYDLAQGIAALGGVVRVDGVVSLDTGLDRAAYQQLYAQPVASLPAPVRAALRSTVGPHIAVLTVITGGAPTSDGARGLVRDIRAMQVPGGQLLVTGPTAIDLDSTAFILARTPAAVAFVVVATAAVLFLLLRSLLLPLKAILMNALSIAASFGALVWIFQDGHLATLLGFTPAPIDPTVPVLLFCIVFGLSMDYEVLMLTRIKEEYALTGENTRAVERGLQSCGRLITGAAAIMILVFSAFALADVVVLKAIGLGLAIAVAIDASLVRILIVPASMRLLGRANWWPTRIHPPNLPKIPAPLAGEG